MRTYGFLGAGHMSQAIIRSLIESASVKPEHIWVSNRSAGKLDRLVEQTGVHKAANNEELIDKAEVILLGVKPQDLVTAVEPIASSFDGSHIVVSLAAGVSLQNLKKLIPNVNQLIRIMPNAAVKVRRSVIGCSVSGEALWLKTLAQDLFKPLGEIVFVEEGEAFEALTVACSSGIGFVYELMEYWQDWLMDHDFSSEEARRMTVGTFMGAALMAHETPLTTIEELQNKVVSKKGVTAAGLDSIRELEMERLLRISFEKAVMRDRELGRLD